LRVRYHDQERVPVHDWRHLEMVSMTTMSYMPWEGRSACPCRDAKIEETERERVPVHDKNTLYPRHKAK